MKKNGFSLVELLIGAGLLSALGIGFMTYFKNSSQSQNELLNSFEVIDLKHDIHFYLADDKSCSASLQGLTFKGSTIKNTPINNIEIWSGDQNSAKVTKRLYSGLMRGRVKINSISLNMPDYTAGVNFPQGINQNFKAQIVFKLTKSNFSKIKNVDDINYILNLFFNTDSSGNSTIAGCEATLSSNSNNKFFTIWGNSTCPPGFNTLKTGKSFSSSITGAGSPGSDMICSSGIIRKLYRVNDSHSGYLWDNPLDCAICADTSSKICFTNFGTNSCPSGFSASYVGHLFQTAWANSGTSGKFICREGATIGGIYTVNAAISGYEWVNGDPCAECCSN